VEEKRLRIEVYISPKCPTKEAVEKNLKEALELEGIPAHLTVEVISPDEAKKRGLKGSPTIIINGEVFQPIEGSSFS
jgi:glutaredoxin